mmetsp:Transcript_26734/g.63211  ORF Transcript_26734/g.63211 Transcript_26734/m.63211 type:complete len:220 (-) Transcript_26734:356-1015(-)
MVQVVEAAVPEARRVAEVRAVQARPAPVAPHRNLVIVPHGSGESLKGLDGHRVRQALPFEHVVHNLVAPRPRRRGRAASRAEAAAVPLAQLVLLPTAARAIPHHHHQRRVTRRRRSQTPWIARALFLLRVDSLLLLLEGVVVVAACHREVLRTRLTKDGRLATLLAETGHLLQEPRHVHPVCLRRWLHVPGAFGCGAAVVQAEVEHDGVRAHRRHQRHV